MFRIVLTLLVSFMLLAGVAGCPGPGAPTKVDNRPPGLGLGGGPPDSNGKTGDNKPPTIEH